MGMNYIIGRLINRSFDALLRHRSLPLFRSFGLGRRYEYDIARFAGTRDLRMFFDVGANIGQTSRELLRYYPAATIHAFEPIQATYAQLERNLAHHPNVRTHQLALGDQAGVLEVELQSDPFLNSLNFGTNPGPTGTGQRERITVSTVNDVCAANQIPFLDLLKVDAQGADLKVLKGAGGMLDRDCVRFVLCEVGFDAADEINQPFVPVHEYLQSRGMMLCGFYGPVRNGPRQAFVGFRDALYANPLLLGSP